MALGAKGTVFVGSMDARQVYAIIDRNGAREVKVIATNLSKPTGVAFRNGALYIATTTSILRLDDIEARLDAPPAPITVISGLPGVHHDWKFLAFGPDGLMYVSVGSPCNVCEKEILDDPRYATIMRMTPDGKNPEIFAHGVRNSVGFDWSPETHEMWFSDNGRDNLGDDIPSDELNIAPRAGMHFGFPYCNQGDLKDPDFGSDKHPCSDFTPPVLKLGPHVASIGMEFYTGKMFPKEYQNSIFVAQHGSWNRSVPIGYRVMWVKVSGSKVLSYEPFVDGFLHGVRGTPTADRATGDAYARPAHVLTLSDGSLLVSDDSGPNGRGGRIFRVTYGAAK
jgi:glucose/arabinose dehydrogenase